MIPATQLYNNRTTHNAQAERVGADWPHIATPAEQLAALHALIRVYDRHVPLPTTVAASEDLARELLREWCRR